MLEKLTRTTPPMLQGKRPEKQCNYRVATQSNYNNSADVKAYLRATAKSLDRVKRSLLLLGNMAARMRVKRPGEEDNNSETVHNTSCRV